MSGVKEKPQNVRFEYDGYADGFPVYDMAFCPTCNREFEDGDAVWGCNYCPDCGQRLKWDWRKMVSGNRRN